ncbi:unnamed protein product [Urochloa humidicola]
MAPHRPRKSSGFVMPRPRYRRWRRPPTPYSRCPRRSSTRSSAASTSATPFAPPRRHWESLPSLDIVIPYGQQTPWIVDSVLPRCSGRVRRFHTFLDDDFSTRRLDDWLLVFSSRHDGVEDLNLVRNGKRFFLHSCVFSWRRLVSLDLFNCHFPPIPPSFEGFPDLKVLSLCNVKLQQNGEHQLEEIIETSPLLENLILSEVCIPGDDLIEWEIRAPNLRHITICSNVDYGWNFA